MIGTIHWKVNRGEEAAMAGSLDESVQRWGVLIGSPNTTVEIEFPRMCPSDVTLHYVRMPTDGNIADNDLFEGVVQRTTAGIPAAIDSIMTAEPDHLVLGFGSPGFFAGLDGEQALIDSYVERAGGVGITIPSQSCRRALEVLEVKRLAVMGSYQPAGARRVREYFEAAGYDIVKEGFQGHGSGTEAARMTRHELARALYEMDGPDVDAILQLGVNMPAVEPADAVEQVIGKPVLSVNAVTFWNALRGRGIPTRAAGAGTLLRDH
jgi:maleate isomerase